MPSTLVAFRITSGGEVGVAGARGEYDDTALLQVADGAPPDERLGDRAHLDGSEHARGHAVLLERVLQRERVDDRRQHAHVVGGRAVHAARAGRQATEDVAAADDDGGLHAERADFGDVLGDAGGDRGIHTVGLVAHQRFA
jgi:hypothetical protein